MSKIIWLTGQSGAGKSTLANIIKMEIPCVVLDGDVMRKSISTDLGFSPQDRTEHNMRVAKLAKMLSEQTNVVVSVIAPIDSVRQEITKVCDPVWVYIKRRMPAREGHFYEEPTHWHFMIDNDKLSKEQSATEIRRILVDVFGTKNTYSMFIGRYQPLHEGHTKLISSVLDEGKNVVVALRDTNKTDSDPYSLGERKTMFHKAFQRYIDAGQMTVISIPDIEEVCYGRKVGWGIREIKLDEKTESISATAIRAGKL